MSYIRFGAHGSDVYVFPSDAGMECCGCSLESAKRGEFGCFRSRSLAEVEAHLAEHRAAGHTVPDTVEPAIRADAEWLASEGIGP